MMFKYGEGFGGAWNCFLDVISSVLEGKFTWLIYQLGDADLRIGKPAHAKQAAD